ncbi:hypothetical protein NIES4101_83610 [Calothrix sp. NIES-4101]|nr:hypothetical protein NIES4101_83610 [Calothrix sp. NIES-4101]
MKNLETENKIDRDDNSPSITIIPHQDSLSNNCSIKKELSIIGKEAAKIQLDMFLPKDYSWFYLKKNNKVPFLGFYHRNGDFDIISMEAQKDQWGDYLRNERNNKIWEESENLGDGLEYIEKHPADWFIIPALMDSGIEAQECKGSRVVMFESDGATIEEQWQALEIFYQATSIKPILVVFSGKKSLHCYFGLTEEISPDKYKELKRKAIVCFSSDTSIQNLNREMRFAGSLRPATGNYQEVQWYHPEATLTAAELETALDSFGGLSHGINEQRWSKYIHARNANASQAEILEIIQTPEVLLKAGEDSQEQIQGNSTRKYSSNNFLPGNSEGISLYEFLGKDYKNWVDNGLVAGTGGREPTLGKIAGRLTTIIEDLDSLGIKHLDDAEEICLRYAENCTPELPESEVYRHLAKAAPQDTNPDDSFYISRAKWLLRDNPEQLALLNAKFALEDNSDKESSEENSEKTLDLPLDLPPIPVWEFLRPAHQDFKNFREMSYEGKLGIIVQEIINTCKKLKIETCITEDIFSLYRPECWESFLESFEKVKNKTRRSRLPDKYFLTIARDFYKTHLENKPENACPFVVGNLKESIEILQKRTEEEASATLRRNEAIDIFRDNARVRWNKSRTFTPTRTIETKYVSDGFSPSEVGQKDIIAIKSGLGTGKTHWMVQASKEWDNGLFVIGYRNMLGVQTAKNLGGFHIHQDSEKFIENFANKDATLVYCIDSITRFSGQEHLFEGKTIVIDEALSVCKHVLTSSTFSPARRRECVKTLKNALQVCSRIVLLDGHLTDAVVGWFAELAGEGRTVTKIENIRPVEPSQVNFLVGTVKDPTLWESNELACDDREHSNINFNSHSSMEGAILANSGKFVVLGDCKDKLQALYNKKIEQNPEFKGLVISSDTNGDEGVVKFLQNPTEEIETHQYDGIFYSPTAESGVDISIRSYFKYQYAFFHGLIGASDCKQMLFRVRDPKVVRNVWASPFPLGQDSVAHCNAATTIARDLAVLESAYIEIREQLSKGEITKTSEEFDIDFYLKQFKEQFESPTNKFVGHLKSTSQYETVKCRECLTTMLQESGHHITFLVESPDSDAKELVKEEKLSIQEKFSEKICEAEVILEAEHEELRIKAALTPDEKAKVEKFKLNQQLPNIINSEVWNPKFVFLVNYGDKSLIQRLQRYLLLKNPEILQRKSNTEFVKSFNQLVLEKNTEIIAGDFKVESLKIQALLDAGFANLTNPSLQWHSESSEYLAVKKAVSTVSFQTKWGLELKKNNRGHLLPRKFTDDQALKFVKSCLEWCGAKMIGIGRERINNKQVTIFTLNQEWYSSDFVKAILTALSVKLLDNFGENFKKPVLGQHPSGNKMSKTIDEFIDFLESQFEQDETIVDDSYFWVEDELTPYVGEPLDFGAEIIQLWEYFAPEQLSLQVA